jgi:hypothetical protein
MEAVLECDFHDFPRSFKVGWWAVEATSYPAAQGAFLALVHSVPLSIVEINTLKAFEPTVN